MTETRALAHELVNSLPESQIRGLVEFLRTIVEPERVAVDDEPVTDEDRRRLHEGRRWFAERGGKGISMEEVLAEHGLKPEDFPLNR